MPEQDELVTGRRYLLEQQYADDRNLSARQAIYAYVQPETDIYEWSLGLAELAGTERILDIGCGNGGYLEALRNRGHGGAVVGLDLSPGMLAAARERRTGAAPGVADAVALPLRTASVDVAFSMHMLYHVSDMELAVAELRRVVRPGGIAPVATNSEAHLSELTTLFTVSAEAALGLDLPDFRRNFLRFTMEDGASILGTSFDTVEPHHAKRELVITEVEPVVAYARSIGPLLSFGADEGESIFVEIARRVRAVLDRDGAFRVRTGAGCFVCR